ncbi:MAG: Dihydroneopterin aldolase [Pseudomonadota bacterium]
MHENLRVAILGAGPAGLAAAAWCVELGLAPVVYDGAARPGGQLWRIPGPIRGLAGADDLDGSTLLARLTAPLERARIPVHLGVRMRPVSWGGGGDPLRNASPLAVEGDLPRAEVDAIVLATGVRRRRLGVPGEDARAGLHDNLGPDPARWRGARVVVVGGGDDAFEHAALLAPHAARVVLVHRSARFSAREALRAPVLRDPAVEIRTERRVVALEGDSVIDAVRLDDGTPLEADAVFRCIGPTPDSEGLGVARHPDGSVIVDRLQRTSRRGVFAAGDVCCPEAPTIPTALGHGSTAAKAAEAFLRAGDHAPWPGSPVAEDVLRVEDLVLPARIGAYDWETTRVQSLRFGLAFPVDTARAAARDALADTPDYAAAAEVVRGVLAQGHIRLVETVAERVADALLTRLAVPWVKVRVEKMDVPGPGARAVVEIRRGAGVGT